MPLHQGYFAGGATDVGGEVATCDKLSFYTDVTSAQTSANLFDACEALASCSSLNNGYFAGGDTSGYSNLAHKLVFATEITAAKTTANLSQARRSLAGCASAINGYFAGGTTGNLVNTADKLIFATEVTAAKTTARLTNARLGVTGCASSTNGYFAGGRDFIDYTDVTDKLVFSTDTTAAQTSADLSLPREGPAGIASSINGYFTGGFYTPSEFFSVKADKLVFATDTTAAQVSANLSAGRNYLGGCAGLINGYWAGGATGTGGSDHTTIADKLVFSTDTTAAQTTANLTRSRKELAGLAGGTTYKSIQYFSSGTIVSGAFYQKAITSGSIASGQIGQYHLASGCISSGFINTSVIVVYSFSSGSISRFHLSSGAINSGHLGDNSIINSNITSGSTILTTNLASGAVNSGHISSGTVLSGHIASGQIGQYHLSSGCINSGHIILNSINSGNIASGQIGQYHLGSGSITSGNVGSNAVNSGNIASGTVRNVRFSSGSLANGQIASGVIFEACKNNFFEVLLAEETISGNIPICITSGGNIAIAQGGSGLRMPAIGISDNNILSGSITKIVTNGYMLAINETSNNWSGQANKMLYVSTSGFVPTTTRPDTGLVQRIGVSFSGGLIVMPDIIMNSGNMFAGASGMA